MQGKVTSPRQNPPTPPPPHSTLPQRPSGPPQPLAASSTPAAVAPCDWALTVPGSVLLGAASPDLFRLNAFRITGLAVDATASQINRQVEKLRLAEKFGAASQRPRRAFALDPPPDAEQLRAALQRLHDPEVRLVDEFFWFWPHELGNGNGDEALAVPWSRGMTNACAAEIWSQIEAQHSVSNVSHAQSGGYGAPQGTGSGTSRASRSDRFQRNSLASRTVARGLPALEDAVGQ